jgi:proline dehydrogenase
VGIGSVLTELGEQVASRAEAARVRDRYCDALVESRQRALAVHVSLKLTHLGLDLDPTLAADHVVAIARQAERAQSFLWLDMEESRYVDATLALFRFVRRVHPDVGICLQAYLRRTPADLAALSPLRPAIRLVKGAYNEPAAGAYPRKADVDRAYLALAAELLGRAARERAAGDGAVSTPVFGTHDLAMVRAIAAHARAASLPTGAYEIHMLYGIRTAEQRALAAAGTTVRILISYGTAWFAWYMRRLAERPANVWFVLRHLL